MAFSNEGQSWWTVIQVWELFNSHSATKAAESLTGTVTCLPGWWVISSYIIDMISIRKFVSLSKYAS